VLGAGVASEFASVQIAKGHWARRNYCRSARQRYAEVAQKIGADHVVDLSMPNHKRFVKGCSIAHHEWYGADIVIDPVGGEANAAALRALAWCGAMVISWICEW